jgi:transcriptional regulator with XRE-family HTH domain
MYNKNMKTIDRPIFSLNIIKYRKLKGFSQVDLAKQTGLSKRMIAYYETEAVKPPIDKLEVIANALGISVSILLEDKKGNNEITEIDPRILKTALLLKGLNRSDKEYIYGLIKSLYDKTKKTKE